MPYPDWWGHAADLGPHNTDDEGGPIHPAHGQGNSSQVASSVYNQRYDLDGQREINTQPAFNTDEYVAAQSHAKMISELVYYMMVKMEPTDRCLRAPGDIYYPPDWKYAREIDGKWVLPDGQ